MNRPFDAGSYELMKTGVSFSASDDRLKMLYDKAEAACAGNKIVYDSKVFLREGGGYRNIWPETQPMGGAMYACRDPEPGMNNCLVFMQYQRRDGRIPGMLFNDPNRGLCAAYSWFQGFCFPRPALQMYYYSGMRREYLEMLYNTLKDYDAYLWANRADENGLLERWCCWDTGEDNLSLLLENGGCDGHFGGEIRPEPVINEMPWKSMEFMAYSCCARDTLADISRMLSNGEETFWRGKAQELRRRVKEQMWVAERKACFDIDSRGRRLDCLSHVNLRCMYYGLFTPEMAEDFVRTHLLNPQEFDTPVPIPSIAVNDPWFRNIRNNNWSGPSQGLTMQRSVCALLNYGYCAEAVHFGRKWLDNLIKTGVLTQQYDPFTGVPSTGPDGYGPTSLSVLEYIALMYGVHVENDLLAFGAAEDGTETNYIQTLGENTYRLVRRDGRMLGYMNERKLFDAPQGLRITVSTDGMPLSVTSLKEESFEAELTLDGRKTWLECAKNRCIEVIGGQA